jgi:hypothetical protein
MKQKQAPFWVYLNFPYDNAKLPSPLERRLTLGQATKLSILKMAADLKNVVVNNACDSIETTVDVIKCVALFYKLGSSPKDFIRKEKFRMQLPCSVRKVLHLK